MQPKYKYLLSPEEAIGGEVDPLAGAASGWEAPKFPILAPDRICNFQIKTAKVKPVKDHPERQQLEIVFVTTKDYSDEDGRPLRAGYKVIHRIGISPTPETDEKRGRSWKNIGEDLAMALKWCGLAGEKSPRDLINDPSIIEGYKGDMRVGKGKETPEFPASNTLKWSLPA